MSSLSSTIGHVAAWTLAIGVVLQAPSTFAQAVDYSAAEQMFGEPVTQSVTGKPQRASEAPADMTIITNQDIRRTGAINLPDVLRFVPGLDVRRYGQDTAAVAIRGYNTALNPRVLVLLDGRQVYEDDYGFVNWALIPVTMTEIRQIEIVKGPSAALYGFNAVSGVINIITFDPLSDKVNGLLVEGGSQNTAYGEAVATIRGADRYGLRFSAKGFRAREFEGTDSNSIGANPRSGMVSGDGRLRIAPGLDWTVSASLSSSQGNLFTDTGAYQPVQLGANSLRSRLNADSGIGLLELDVYRNENLSGLNSPQANLNWREDVTVVRASDVVKLGSNHVIRLGGEWRDNTIRSLNTFNGRFGYSIVAGSAMWEWQVLPNLAITNAIRIDSLSLTHNGPQFDVPWTGSLYQKATITQPSFNTGIVLKLSDSDTVRLSAARALQLPSLVDFGIGANLPTGAIIAGNAGLRPSAVTNLELDYDRSLSSLASTVRLAIFGQYTDTTIGSPFGSGSVTLTNNTSVLMAQNFGSSREIGGEIEFKGQVAGFRWSASYALASVQDATPEETLAAAPSVSYQRQTPVHAVIVTGGKTWGRLDVDVQARWQSHFQDFHVDLGSFQTVPVTVPNYVTASAHVGYRLTDSVTLSLVGEQLLTHRLMQAGGVRTERRLLGGLRCQF